MIFTNSKKLNQYILGAIGFAFCFSGAQAVATENASYLAEYELYSAALQDGDDAAAATHSHAAWQAAESALGDDNRTAMLAYNYAQCVLFTDTANAQLALQRASELQKSGVAELPASELHLKLSFAKFDQKGQKRRESKKLREALIAFDAVNISATPVSAVVWARLANADLMAKRYEDAMNSAASAGAAVDQALPNSYQRKAEAIMIGGAARLELHSQSLADVEAAQLSFAQARDLVAQTDADESADALLSLINQWDQTASEAHAKAE